MEQILQYFTHDYARIIEFIRQVGKQDLNCEAYKWFINLLSAGISCG